jgi:hypothetical protein
MYACGGPSKYVIGYLIVLEDGSVIWSDVRDTSISKKNGAFTTELISMVSTGEVGPRLRELMQLGMLEIGMRALDEERAAALLFLERIPGEGG